MKIKAIKIDVNHMQVSQIEMEYSLAGIHEAVECYVFADVDLPDSFTTNQPHSLLVDDEGSFSNTYLFRIDDQFFFGNGVIVGFNPLTSRYIDCNLDCSFVQSAVAFYTVTPASL
jgi:hypothetical protein